MNNYVLVNMTNGFGNNIFQYTAARLLATFHKKEVYANPPWEDYYGISDLEKFMHAARGGQHNHFPRTNT